MTVAFRDATRADVPAVVELLKDDALGARREVAEMAAYLAAFDRMGEEGANTVIVGEDAGRIVATCQLTFITGLSLRAARRAQVEGVRVASDRRGEGIGHAMLAEVEARSRAAGCSLLQLTMDATRTDARRFYEELGFTRSHTGFKKQL